MRGDQKSPFEQFYSGVPDLPSERLETWEIGYLGDWRNWRTSLDVRLFNENIHNRLFKIDMAFDGNPSTQGHSTIPIQNVNIQGVEYQFKWQPFEATRVVLSQAFAHVDSDYLASALPIIDPSKVGDIKNFTEYSMPGRSTSILLMQKLPFGLEFSTAGYWQDKMKWSTNTWAQKYHRVDARLGYPFRSGSIGGELAFTVQSLNGAHNEYKWNGEPADRIVERRQWVSLRLDF